LTLQDFEKIRKYFEKGVSVILKEKNKAMEKLL
jgi:hypothetical protein